MPNGSQPDEAPQLDAADDDSTMDEQGATTTHSTHTAMTSVDDMNDELATETAINTATTSEPDSDDGDCDNASIYPASHYPRVSFRHATEQPFLNVNMQRDGSDM